MNTKEQTTPAMQTGSVPQSKIACPPQPGRRRKNEHSKMESSASLALLTKEAPPSPVALLTAEAQSKFKIQNSKMASEIALIEPLALAPSGARLTARRAKHSARRQGRVASLPQLQ